ncbi:hypothetical protein JTB14_013147 [Gonioctena quinquepunctata]|nr:hypothetical protein JTB14_013147 [Gonioctena quinquepunctata]
MKTVVSRTGVEVLYPSSIHLLVNGEILECEYKSDNTGKDLIDYVCEQLHVQEKDLWGLKFVDTYEQRHWLDPCRLIRPQVRNVSPIHFQFRVKVYPPNPYKLSDPEAKHQIFYQLKLDLYSGRLCCGPGDASLFLALILQYIHGDFNPQAHCENYINEKIIVNQSFASEMKAIDLHKNHLTGLNQTQIVDLFLRMASQLETYGIDPHLAENLNREKFTLWMNYKGIITYVEGRKIHHLEWMTINRINQEDNKLVVLTCTGESETFLCLTKPECNYIYQSAIAHLTYFTNSGTQSTVGIMGIDSTKELHEDLKSFEYLEESESYEQDDLQMVEYERPSVSKFSSLQFQIWFSVVIIFILGVTYEL